MAWLSICWKLGLCLILTAHTAKGTIVATHHIPLDSSEMKGSSKSDSSKNPKEYKYIEELLNYPQGNMQSGSKNPNLQSFKNSKHESSQPYSHAFEEEYHHTLNQNLHKQPHEKPQSHNSNGYQGTPLSQHKGVISQKNYKPQNYGGNKNYPPGPQSTQLNQKPQGYSGNSYDTYDSQTSQPNQKPQSYSGHNHQPHGPYSTQPNQKPQGYSGHNHQPQGPYSSQPNKKPQSYSGHNHQPQGPYSSQPNQKPYDYSGKNHEIYDSHSPQSNINPNSYNDNNYSPPGHHSSQPKQKPHSYSGNSYKPPNTHSAQPNQKPQSYSGNNYRPHGPKSSQPNQKPQSYSGDSYQPYNPESIQPNQKPEIYNGNYPQHGPQTVQTHDAPHSFSGNSYQPQSPQPLNLAVHNYEINPITVSPDVPNKVSQANSGGHYNAFFKYGKPNHPSQFFTANEYYYENHKINPPGGAGLYTSLENGKENKPVDANKHFGYEIGENVQGLGFNHQIINTEHTQHPSGLKGGNYNNIPIPVTVAHGGNGNSYPNKINSGLNQGYGGNKYPFSTGQHYQNHENGNKYNHPSKGGYGYTHLNQNSHDKKENVKKLNTGYAVSSEVGDNSPYNHHSYEQSYDHGGKPVPFDCSMCPNKGNGHYNTVPQGHENDGNHHNYDTSQEQSDPNHEEQYEEGPHDSSHEDLDERNRKGHFRSHMRNRKGKKPVPNKHNKGHFGHMRNHNSQSDFAKKYSLDSSKATVTRSESSSKSGNHKENLQYTTAAYGNQFYTQRQNGNTDGLTYVQRKLNPLKTHKLIATEQTPKTKNNPVIHEIYVSEPLIKDNDVFMNSMSS